MSTNGYATILAIALQVVLAVIGIYDVLVSCGIIQGRTVSVIMHNWAAQFPVLTLLIGLLLGHLFWPVFPGGRHGP